MSKESIESALRERFNAPLKDYYKRRIIFWQDSEGEFSEMIDELVLPSVKVLKLTGSNNFIAKKTLLVDDTESNYLIYNPISYDSIKDDWFLDVEQMSEEFKADLLSVRMQEFGIPSTGQFRKLLKDYNKFFDNKDRVNRFKALDSKYTSTGQLHIDILAVLAKTTVNTIPGIIRAVLQDDLNIADNNAIINIQKFGDERVLWEAIYRYTGYKYSDETLTLVSLASHILLTALSVTMREGSLSTLSKFISEPHNQNCYSLVYDWLHSDDSDALYNISRVVEEERNLLSLFDKLEIEDLLDSECLPCINECILTKLMQEIADNVIKIDSITKAVERRRTLEWYKRVEYYFDGLLQVANMYRFYQDNINAFHTAEYKQLWNNYSDNYCKMDYYYRMFHTAFSRAIKNPNTLLEDLYKTVADWVENLYKNWYLQQLSSQWTMLMTDELSKNACLKEIPQQCDFYNNTVGPIAKSQRVFVIISDALRYEVAVEITGALVRETRGSAKLSSMQATFPSATKFGMAALLPHDSITLTEDGKVLCDGQPTDGVSNREKLLQAKAPGNVAIQYKALLAMKQAERRERIANATVVYVYHNMIDAIGDKAQTEDQVFDACEQTVVEIKNLVRLIVNDMGGTNIVVTSDHGFLYSDKPLAEADKIEKNFIDGSVLELDRRYVIADSDCKAEYMIKIPLRHLNSDKCGFTPLSNIRMKKSGGGANYVHGGVSLQELVVPVIEYKNIKASSKKFVDIKKVELQLISQSHKVSNSIFALDFYQKDAVRGKLISADYDIYMTDSMGNIVSDIQTIIADKTSANGADRMFRPRFTLKSADFNKTETYYLNIVDKDNQDVVERFEFTIDIAFVNDFDF